MFPLILAFTWPPFAIASFRYRGPRPAMLAGGLVAAVGLAASLYCGFLPAAAVSAVWVMFAAAMGLGRPAGLSRRQRRQEWRREHQRRALAREMAWAPVFDEAREELDSADKLVPVLLRAPRRVR